MKKRKKLKLKKEVKFLILFYLLVIILAIFTSWRFNQLGI